MYNPNSLGAAPLVAAALGRSLGVEIHVSEKASTAFTDGTSRITLPALPVDVDEQTERMLWGFIHHEAGHCRHSDLAYQDDPIVDDEFIRKIVGILEDARMEAAHIALYPGAEKILKKLMETLVDIEFWTKPSDEHKPSEAFIAFVLYYLRSTFLDQSALIPFRDRARRLLEDELGSALVSRIVSILQTVRQANETYDCVDIAINLRSLLRDEQESAKSEPPQESPSVPNDDSSSEDSTEGTHHHQSDALAEILGGEVNEDLNLGDLGDCLGSAISDQLDNNATSRALSLPNGVIEIDGRLDETAIRLAKSHTSKLSSQLKRVLESTKRMPSSRHKRGKRIGRRDVHRIALDDPRIFRRKVRQPAVNTAVVELKDVSSSMRDRILIANDATLATSLALSEVKNVEHSVAAFPAKERGESIEVVKDFDESTSRVSSRFNTSAHGGTPMAEALLWAGWQLSKRREHRKIIVVSTDGHPDDADSSTGECPVTKSVIEHLRTSGIEIHGLMIDTTDKYNLFDSSRTITHISELTSAYVELFERVLKVA
ncbi:MAG: hypothetical protein GKR90_25420 [Pseudomonadales bacterium]|nr:hypothetical protein [Pseudomonadales bacterium]